MTVSVGVISLFRKLSRTQVDEALGLKAQRPLAFRFGFRSRRPLATCESLNLQREVLPLFCILPEMRKRKFKSTSEVIGDADAVLLAHIVNALANQLVQFAQRVRPVGSQ